MFQIKYEKVTKIFFFLILLVFNCNLIKAEVSNKTIGIKPYCNGNFFIKPGELNSHKALPKKIKIEFNNSNKWYTNLFQLIQVLGSKEYKHTIKIPKQFKKFSPVNIQVLFRNNIKCNFKGEARIHGGRGSHVSYGSFNTSLNVRIIDGNINNISEFILFLPETRKGDNEILTTVLLNDLGILSPFTMNVEAKINNEKYIKYLFQEKINENFLLRNKKVNSLILASNKSYQVHDLDKNFSDSTGRLSFIAESSADVKAQYSDSSSESNYINAINNSNYFFIQNYIANENIMINQFFRDDDGLITYTEAAKDNYERIDYNKFYIFESLMLALGAEHANIHDMKFFFDNFSNLLEPIYYDGVGSILEDYDISLRKNFTGKVFNSQKQGALILKDYLSNLNKDDLLRKLEIRNFNNNLYDLNKILKLINKNVQTILNSETAYIKFKNKNFSFLSSKKSSSKKIFLAFGGKNNVFKVCNINVLDCYETLVKTNDIKQIFTKHISKIDGKNVLYVRSSVDEFLKRKIPPKHGIELFKKISIDKINNIFFKEKDTFIKINKEKREILINVYNPNERIVIISKDLKDWNLIYKNKSFLLSNIRTSGIKGFFPSGCINFLDSTVHNIKIKIQNADCPDALQFIRSNGDVSEVEIINSAYDALDVDFSNLEFKKVNINSAKQECLGFKSGLYKVHNAILSNCKDKAISVGEISTAFFDKVFITNSTHGIVSKDTAEIYVENFKSEKILTSCLAAYRGKNNFTGSYIRINNLINKCDVEAFEENGSKIDIINYDF